MNYYDLHNPENARQVPYIRACAYHQKDSEFNEKT